MKKLILIELNEFNVDFFSKALKLQNFEGIRRLLDMNRSHSWTDDETEHKGLDPWVQWVSIHSGVSSAEHGIRHLGDVPQLDKPQLWEKLSSMGVSSGVFGAMNASRGSATQCKFFFPDPWTFSEKAFPEKLNALLEFPRYYSKNYLDLDYWTCFKSVFGLLGFFLTERSLFRILKRSPMMLKGVFKFGLKTHVLFSSFDLVFAQLFLERRKKNPQFSLVFLNSVAHMQHNIWSPSDQLSPACLYSLSMIDQALLDIFDGCDADEEIIVMNALGQVNIIEEKSDILYRQKNPEQFFQKLGLPFEKVEQLMTNDGHVLFASESDARSASELLSATTVCGIKAFDVDYDPSTPCKLFYQVDCWDEVPPGECLIAGDLQLDFHECFEAVVTRTGEHVQQGEIFTRKMILPHKTYNHEMYQTIVDYFSPETGAGQTS